MNGHTCWITRGYASAPVCSRILVGAFGQPFEFTLREFVVWDLLGGFWGEGIDRLVSDEILSNHGVHKS
jgi:hypothetical protein